MIITDDDVEAACAAYWTDWPRMKTWPKTGPSIQVSMRRALEAVVAARAAAAEREEILIIIDHMKEPKA